MTEKQKQLQKLSKILRKIDEYDMYIHAHYTPQEVLDVYEKDEKKKHFYGGSCGLVNVVWTEADNDIEAEQYEY